MTYLLLRPLLAWYRRAGRRQRRVLKVLIEPIRLTLARLGDPGYRVKVRGRRLSLPASHLLPFTVADHPLYDTLPARIAAHLRRQRGRLVMIDIGANVGDTIAACADPNSADRYLAVEASDRYRRHLTRNTLGLAVTTIAAYCHSEEDPDATVTVQAEGGTARVREDPGGRGIPKRTIDGLVSTHPEFAVVDFLKTDTDGNDLAVLAGAVSTIATARPIVLMECAPYGESDYRKQVAGLVDRFATAGYAHVVAYDQYGHWFASARLDGQVALASALAYQVISDFGYFDLLFLGPGDDALLRSERDYFIRFAAMERGVDIADLLDV